jgi:hypothetical protein
VIAIGLRGGHAFPVQTGSPGSGMTPSRIGGHGGRIQLEDCMIDATWIDYWEKPYLDKYDDEGVLNRPITHSVARPNSHECHAESYGGSRGCRLKATTRYRVLRGHTNDFSAI